MYTFVTEDDSYSDDEDCFGFLARGCNRHLLEVGYEEDAEWGSCTIKSFMEEITQIPLLMDIEWHWDESSSTLGFSSTTNKPADELVLSLILTRELIQRIPSYEKLKQYFGVSTPNIKQTSFLALATLQFGWGTNYRTGGLSEVHMSPQYIYEEDIVYLPAFGVKSLENWVNGEYDFVQDNFRDRGYYCRENKLRHSEEEYPSAMSEKLTRKNIYDPKLKPRATMTCCMCVPDDEPLQFDSPEKVKEYFSTL